MWQKIQNWFFTDPQSACASATAATKNCVKVQTSTGTTYTEVFHFYGPWIAFCVLALVIIAYYWLEARSRIVKGRTLPVHRYILDRFMNQLFVLVVVAPMLMFGRWALDASFFAWRIWRYLWLAWAAGIAVYWIVYLIRHYPEERAYYLQQRTNAQYMHPARNKRKGVAKAGSR